MRHTIIIIIIIHFIHGSLFVTYQYINYLQTDFQRANFATHM